MSVLDREGRQLGPDEVRFIEQLPKAELHIHLEGAVRPATLLELGRRHGIAYPFHDADAARDWYRFRDFPHFIEIFIAVCDALLTSEDIERITYELGEDAHRQNIRYLEVIISPTSILRPRTRANPDVYWAGVTAAASRVQRDFGVIMRFHLDAVRTRLVEEVMAMARWAAERLDEGLVGFNLGGTEAGYPASLHQKAIAYAHDAGLGISLHAGETVGPESVWDALGAGAERIGHGVTSITDPALLEHLARERIVLEVSPSSNVCLGVVPSWPEHPIRRLADAGVLVTLNSDDPPMFDTDLNQEYRRLAAIHGFSCRELAELSLRAPRAAFLPAAEKQLLLDTFQAEIDRLLASLA
ncbi:MAG TPA: adenosine deaminase [Thermomicrobiaceae bacterium]|nr:adenosine deaminase [Thermomicrobiaceae bacterium]